MDLNLKTKNVLITGASKGIGLACAKEFAAEGCNLHLVSRTEEDLLTAKKQIGDNNDVDITVYPLDLSRSSDVDTLAKKCSNVDILINNAGAIPAGDIEAIDELTGGHIDRGIQHGVNFVRQAVGQAPNPIRDTYKPQEGG